MRSLINRNPRIWNKKLLYEKKNKLVLAAVKYQTNQFFSSLSRILDVLNCLEHGLTAMVKHNIMTLSLYFSNSEMIDSCKNLR